MRLNVTKWFPDNSVEVSIPDQCKSLLGHARSHMEFTDLPSASRYFSKLMRQAKRAEQFARFGQAELNADLTPKHTSKPKHGLLLTGKASGRFKSFATK